MLTQGIGFHSGESYWLVGKMYSTYDSVQEQTVLFAGKGGFDVKVGEHTQLNGAVIGSTASAEHNRLETGTLGFSDIENQAAYKVEHQSVGASTGGGMANFIGNLANGLAVAGNKEKGDNSTTHAAVSDGTIIINDTAKQQQNVDDLSRDSIPFRVREVNGRSAAQATCHIVVRCGHCSAIQHNVGVLCALLRLALHSTVTR
ncbi:hypothetical protein [Rosenbergiella epipactidis]|uniref:hypothetical protein n=1 Tax=Rosenbergiella epipactidis TaxID=1544694 RepID=UPI001F5015C7|nr:hypothetical protein [Rosenbergiella epipactidis]